jgi:hypothetical protein
MASDYKAESFERTSRKLLNTSYSRRCMHAGLCQIHNYLSVDDRTTTMFSKHAKLILRDVDPKSVAAVLCTQS